MRPVLVEAAPDLIPLFEADFGDAVKALHERSEDAKKARGEADRVRDAIARQEAVLSRERERLEAARAQLANDASAFGFAAADVRDVTDAAERRLAIIADLANADERLRLASGTTPEEYDALVASLTYEGIRAHVLALVDEKNDVDRRHTEKITARLEVQAKIERIDASNEAAEAAAELQSIGGEIDRAAREYAALAVARTVFQRELARFAEANQGPLIDGASRYLAELTYGRYTAIQIVEGDSGKPELEIKGPRGPVDVSALSDGTADQLYFALRLAAIEEYLSTAPPVPIVIDDAFVNFDDDRTLAAMRSLGELGARTQVIYFTHHRRTAELAIEALRENVEVIELASALLTSTPTEAA